MTQITRVGEFHIGDKVRLKDGDGRPHIIKSFERVKGIHGPDFYIVHFEDDSATDLIFPERNSIANHYTSMIKL